METTVEDAYSAATSGARALMKAWGDSARPEQLAAVDAAVRAGGIVRVVVDGGLHGVPFVVSGWLVHPDGTVDRLFEIAPPDSAAQPTLRRVN